jgi:hypothetical protein
MVKTDRIAITHQQGEAAERPTLAAAKSIQLIKGSSMRSTLAAVGCKELFGAAL